MQEISTEEIRSELVSLRTEIGRLGFAKAHSDWSAHADWSSSSKALEGQFSLATKIGNPAEAIQLEKIMNDASSDRFLEVAKSLNSLLKESK